MNLTQDVNFPLYVRRQDLTKFLVRYELFKMAMHVHGSIIECGVLGGAGVMAWYHLSSIFEPYNHTRRIVGFDTFEGFPHVSDNDRTEEVQHHIGEMASDSYDQILGVVQEHDANRPIGHIPKVELVKGDALDTIPKYQSNNPHLIVALLYCDFDLYEPTDTALRYFLHLMPKGAIVAFDEAGNKNWPGETQALLPYLGDLKLQRMPWQSTVSYAVI